MLSNYSTNLEGKVKYRYLDKISEIGIDPLLITAKKLSEECLPPVESMDSVVQPTSPIGAFSF